MSSNTRETESPSAIELQPLNRNAMRLQVHAALFGTTERGVHPSPSVDPFLDHLGKRFDDLAVEQECWSWYSWVEEIWQTLEQQTSGDPTIGQILHALNVGDLPFADRCRTLQDSLSTLCLLSGTIAPIRQGSRPDAFTVPNPSDPNNLSLDLGAEYTQGPQFWRGTGQQTFGEVLITIQRQQVWDQDAEFLRKMAEHGHEPLHIEGLRFSIISAFGVPHIRFVDTLEAHLCVDESTGTISLYKYPSFCLAALQDREHTSTLLTRMAFWTTDRAALRVPYNRARALSVFREVLLSYQILFSNRASRKLLLEALKEQDGPGPDPLLARLARPGCVFRLCTTEMRLQGTHTLRR